MSAPFPYAGEIASVSSAAFWAIAVVLFKKTGEKAAPLPLNLFKNVVALVFFIPAAQFIEKRPEGDATFWLLLAVSGVVGITLADTLFFAALNRLGAGLNAVVDCLYSPSMIFLAVIFLGDRMTVQIAGGAVLVMTAVLLGSAAKPVAGRTRADLLKGLALGALGMVLVAASIVLIKTRLSGDKALWIITTRIAVGTVFLLPIIHMRGEGAAVRALFAPTRLWRVAIPASVAGTVGAMTCWILGMTWLDVSRAAVLNQLSTIFIFVLAAVVLKEPFTPRRLAAVALAFAGAVLVLSGRASDEETTQVPRTIGAAPAKRGAGSDGLDRLHLGHPLADPLLDAGLQRHLGHRAAAAGSHQAHVDRAVLHVDEFHVAPVGLKERANGVEGLLDLLTHGIPPTVLSGPERGV